VFECVPDILPCAHAAVNLGNTGKQILGGIDAHPG
jgi:hypothetical protein